MSIPWVEKYRPTNFDGLILDPLNRKILMNILEKTLFQICYFMDHQEQVKQLLLLT